MYYSVVAMQGADQIKPTDILRFPWEQNNTGEQRKLKTKKERQQYWKEFDAKKKKKIR